MQMIVNEVASFRNGAKSPTRKTKVNYKAEEDALIVKRRRMETISQTIKIPKSNGLKMKPSL